MSSAIQRGLAQLRRGELAAAEADLVHADELAKELGAVAPAAFSRAYLALVRVERGSAGDADELESIPQGLLTSAHLTLQHARALVRLARGDRAGGIRDLRAVGDQLEQLGTVSPGVIPWRTQLSEALAQDRPEEARILAEEELRCAREAGLAVAEGLALRVLALGEAGESRTRLLERSVSVLEPSFARLEHARALADLGTAMRLDGRPQEARPALLRALDQAHRCGARPLAERARAEAVAAGARPRRPRLTGVEALTPSELRVAQLASEGLSNREIAQALFVTTKTVTDHLAATYRKLDVPGREGLAGALGRTAA
jgi:DNA-binding CsgD family transcriptional regulator